MGKSVGKNLRRGERQKTVARIGNATTHGMALSMSGTTLARGNFVAAKESKKSKKKTRAGKAKARGN
jgi:hypothetical protein